jgi:hypothetical protein
MIALQKMLIQTSGNTTYLLPAWPEKWDVEFKLWTSGNSFIEGSYSAKKGLKISNKKVPKLVQIVNYMETPIIQ